MLPKELCTIVLEYLLSVATVVVAAFATTIAIAKVTGRLGRLDAGFHLRSGTRSLEFFTGVSRGLVGVAACRLALASMDAPLLWGIVVLPTLPLVCWDLWRLYFHSKYWMNSAVTAIAYKHFPDDVAAEALREAGAQGRRLASVIRSTFYGDILGIGSGALAFLALAKAL